MMLSLSRYAASPESGMLGVRALGRAGFLARRDWLDGLIGDVP